MGGGKTVLHHQSHVTLRMVPHARTLRKAREQIKWMVIDGASPRRIKNYLHLWARWWANTSDTWHYLEILQQFIDVCWDQTVTTFATVLAHIYFNKLHTETSSLLAAAA
jgi:hypothetical protein